MQCHFLSKQVVIETLKMFIVLFFIQIFVRIVYLIVNKFPDCRYKVNHNLTGRAQYLTASSGAGFVFHDCIGPSSIS